MDAVLAAGGLFDAQPSRRGVERFLNASGHHLLVAYVEVTPAGFVTGVEMTHPDKGTEMFLYELGVDPRFRGRGVGRSLVTALATRAKSRGCYGMWVLTEPDNDAAAKTYLAAGQAPRIPSRC